MRRRDGDRPPRRGRADGVGGVAAAPHRHRRGRLRRHQDGVGLVPRVPGLPAAVPGGPLQLRGGELRPRRRARARRDRPDAAARRDGGRRATLPWEQSVESLLATRRPPALRRADASRDTGAPLAVELSLVQDTPEPFRPVIHGYGRHGPAEDLRAQAPSPPGEPAASAPGSPGTCPGPGSITCCCATSSRSRTSACWHELYALYRASAAAHSASLRVRLRVGGDQRYLDLSPASPASSGRSSTRRTPSARRSSTRRGRAWCGRRARRNCASTSQRRRRPRPADRPGHQDRRQQDAVRSTAFP